MNRLIPLALGAVIIASGAYVALRPTEPERTNASPASAARAPIVEVTVPETLSAQAQIGETAFNAVCAACHGQNAEGKDGFGPPLIHKIYEPNHHADYAFLSAVQNGVNAHHWPFGNMPPQEGLTQGDVKNIVAFVREVQRANGIQ